MLEWAVIGLIWPGPGLLQTDMCVLAEVGPRPTYPARYVGWADISPRPPGRHKPSGWAAFHPDPTRHLAILDGPPPRSSGWARPGRHTGPPCRIIRQADVSRDGLQAEANRVTISTPGRGTQQAGLLFVSGRIPGRGTRPEHRSGATQLAPHAPFVRHLNRHFTRPGWIVSMPTYLATSARHLG